MIFKRAAAFTILLSSALYAKEGFPTDHSGHVHEADGDHNDFSLGGKALIHPFNVEEAFLGNDFFATYRYREGSDLTEQEIEVELELKLTDWLGLTIEVPYVFEDEEGEGSGSGFGDLAIAPKVVVHQSEQFYLTLQTEVTLPTGSTDFGNETAIAPAILLWTDLGNNLALNTSVGVEYEFDEAETELALGFSLVKTFDLKGTDGGGELTTAGLLSFHAEAVTSLALSGEEDGEFSASGLVGATYGLSEGLDLRAAYEFPLTTDEELDNGVVVGIIAHF